MADLEHSRSIITTLAGLPAFLRRSMLERRLAEFYELDADSQREVVDGALASAPSIPFDDLERLLRTWLEVLCTLPEQRRRAIFAAYAAEACRSPEKFAALNLDGMLGVLLSLGERERATIAASAGAAILGAGCAERLDAVIPHSARRHVGL